jgi:hypothetical protein
MTEKRISLLQKVKNSFSKQKIPEKTELMIAGIDSLGELRLSLDSEIAESEALAEELERKIANVGLEVDEKKDDIREGACFSEHAKLATLRAIKRLSSQLESFNRRLKIYQDNIDLHYIILHQVDEMEAMEMKAIKKDQIDHISVDYEEKLEKHRDLMNAVRSTASEGYDDVTEMKELAKIEAGIMKEKEEEEEKKLRPSLDDVIKEKKEPRYEDFKDYREFEQ